MIVEKLNEEIKLLIGSPQNLLFEGASESDIVDLERRLNKKLPKSFGYFLKACNGALLYQTETILGTKDGEGENQALQVSITSEKAAQSLPDYLIPFYVGFDKHYFDARQVKDGEYPVVAWDSEKLETIPVAH